ncbi:protein kinase [bacterium]|nr:protein kinase [bacterium]
MSEDLCQPGQKIAERYEIRRLLGRGGMAEVYLAWDNNLHREIALKFLCLNTTLDQRHRRLQKDRLLREARAAAQLNHLGIVVIHDLGETDDMPYISMEYIRGKNLRQVQREHLSKGVGLPTREILDITRQVASALDYAHENGVVHRDVKPENIMITPDGTCKIMDFGIARSSAPGLGTLTTHGKLICTWHYTAPEYFKGGDADARGDQFSFGCVVYELLTGRFAFSGEGEHQVWYRITHANPVMPADIVVELPEVVNSIIMKLLSKEPKDRYPSCMAAATALDTALSGLNPSHALNVHPESAENEETTLVAGMDDGNQTRSIATRNRIWWYVLGCICSGLIIGMIFVVFGEKEIEKKKEMETTGQISFVATELPTATAIPSATPTASLTPISIPTQTIMIQATNKPGIKPIVTQIPTVTPKPSPGVIATMTPTPKPTAIPTMIPTIWPRDTITPQSDDLKGEIPWVPF